MKPSRILLVFALLALGPSACASVSSSQYLTSVPRPPSGAEPIVVLEGSAEPPGLQEIAILQAKCEGGGCEMPMVLSRLRQDAARIGATHVVRVRIDTGATQIVAHGVAATSL